MNVILGVEMTFFWGADTWLTAATGLVMGLAAAEVVTVTLPDDAVVAVLFEDTTTGSVEGMGLPSFVCSFSTWKKY